MVTLDRLVNVLGGYGVRLCGSRAPRSTELSGIVVHDAADDRAGSGEVFLAVGARSAADAVRWAMAARSSVVLVRGGDELTAEADALGETERIAVLVVDPSVAWSELAGVVYGLVLEGRETDSGRGPTDLFALADSLASAIGGAVLIIEDRSWRLLAYSSLRQYEADPARVATILARRVPKDLRDLFASRGVLTHLSTSDEPLFVPASPEHELTSRMVVAIRTGRERLGSMWVSCERPLAGDQRAALVDGARTVALHLLRSRASADLERKVESDLVIRLLEGTPDAATVVSRLGLPPGPMRLIAVRPSLGDEPQAGLLLAFELATTGFGWSRPGRSALLGVTLYTLLPGDDVSAAREWVSTLCATLPARAIVWAGIAAPAVPADLRAGRQEADECLALHEARDPTTPPPAYDESWHDILLQRLRAAGRGGRVPARGPVAELRRHDREHGTAYVDTLRAWLAAQGDLAVAGEQLGVHQNTVRNRMRRMAELVSPGLENPLKRFAIAIELAATDGLHDV